MKEFWNDRYGKASFAYGTEPNVFLAQQLPPMPLGNILFVAEGEGRNAVYAANLGWQVAAFDQSLEGQKKAFELAKENNVKIDYKVGELLEIKYEPNSFNVAVLIFAHFNAEDKKQYHQIISTYVKQGGFIIFEAFSKTHLQYNSKNPTVGGPANEGMLFSKDEILNYFSNFETLILEEIVYELNEGDFHKGEGSVIRYVGKKK
jgi:ubiquinone/menaquinone biosynthesis C-methylase UbiE